MQNFRLDAELWEQFGAAIRQHAPESDRSKLLRDFVSWYVHRPGAKLPARPPAAQPASPPPQQSAS
jgi:hypothetical protein